MTCTIPKQNHILYTHKLMAYTNPKSVYMHTKNHTTWYTHTLHYPKNHKTHTTRHRLRAAHTTGRADGPYREPRAGGTRLRGDGQARHQEGHQVPEQGPPGE